jgi:hypothetical protein
MRKLVVFIVMLVAAISLTIVPSTSVSAKDCNDYNYPTWGAVTTFKAGDFQSVQFRLMANSQQLRTLTCLANYLEIDFELHGFHLPPNWEGYNVYTDLPGGMHDTAASDILDKRPAITNIHTKQLIPGRVYTATITWHAQALFWESQAVRMYWTPSYWAKKGTWEGGLCEVSGRAPEWCLFGVGGRTTKLWRVLFPASQAEGWLPIKSGKPLVYKMSYDSLRT